MAPPRQRSIVHLDADAFFASVEQAADPRLRGRPIAVGGEKRGIIASASYEARRFGIYTPMPTALARKLCPKLILLPGDFDKYELFSRLMFSYAYEFTPDVEIGSIDEGYFDLTGTRKPPVDIAQTIRHAIRQSLKLPVSEGIGSNKLVSQIASKLKKPAAFQYVPPGTERQFLEPLPNKWLPGIGPKTATQLNSAGLALVGQVARTPVDLLGLLVGSMAPQLKNFASGIDERPVVPVRAPAKSYGEQETFPADTTDQTFLNATLQRMADKLMAKVRQDGKSIRTLTVKVRYNDMDETQASHSLPEPTDLESDIYSAVSALLTKAWQRRVSLRLVSLKLSNVYAGPFPSGLCLDVHSRQHDARQRLATVVDHVRHKYGRKALLRGHDFVLRDKTVNLRPPPSAPPPLRVTLPISDSRPRTSALRPRRCALIPLNVHSYYSFLDSTLSVKAIVDWAKQNDVPALAITDTNNLHGAVEFAQAAAEAGIKPIIGSDVVWNTKRLCLYVQNKAGYHNLCRILTRLNAARPADRSPSQLQPDFFAHHDTAGLLAVSADPSLAPLFPGRFYFSVQDRETAEKRPAHLPAVAAFPVHYATASDRWKYDIVQSIRTLTLLRQPHPEKRLEHACHFRTRPELGSLAAHPDLLAHSFEIAERCSFAFAFGKPQFPAFKPADGSTPAEFLRRLVMEGLRRRYPAKHQTLRAQLEEELAIIMDVGYEEYFLVMWDILQECRRRGIEWITRGSAADSLACYCLGISGVCPIRFDLYFRRFLNKERMSLNKLPDIDVDFPHDRKDDVIDLIFEKYGTANTAVVGGFSTFQARSAFAEVAKVLGVSDFQVRRITQQFPHFSHTSDLAEAIAQTQECRDLPLDQEPYSTALQMAQFLDGFPRYAKMHPCGLVLSSQPMHELTPCFVSAKGYPTTHFDMDSVETMGLVKMDILAQGGLAVMRDVQQMLSPLRRPAPTAPPCALDDLEPWDDPHVWDLIAGGQARAVHHIESPAMISLCKMCNVRDIDTLIAIVSVIRPGAANESKKMEFARRYQRLSPVIYPHASLEHCLRSTYGLVVYEEHILQICDAFAGLPAGRADVLRRALGKDKTEVIAQIQNEFIACARQRGRSEADIATVWELVTGFRGYAFCKAHSTAYGVEAYQSAWLKYYYPAEFMAAVLTNGKGFYHPLVYILECHRLGIPLLPPSVNEPGPGFTVSGGKIRVPTGQLKGVTERVRETILRERDRSPFVSLNDFWFRTAPSPEDMEILIRAGAFDGLGRPRTAQYWDFKALASGGRPEGSTPKASHARSATGQQVSPVPRQLWLLPPGDLDRLPTVPLAEPTHLQRLQAEEELLGYPVSGHPLDLFPHIAWETYCPIHRLGEHIGEQVVTCGLVIEQRLFHQVTGEPMKFITIADRTGIIETELFARTYRFYGLNTIRYRVLEITAMVEPFENNRGHTLRVIRAGKPRTRR